MYLEKLTIQGFKSFANRTELLFQRGIAAIVGPNGSGKSNVADAMRWVLGEQSLKIIRGKKSEDVIFSGSDKKTRLGMAEVTLTLDNREGRAPIDYKQLTVTRRIHKDGSSEYLVNGSQSRLSDIQLLLARSNIGQRTYSVIGQGQVDAVLVATPMERKQFFDEAAGVRPFQMKKEQAENKLAATRENVAQAQLLIDEIAPRLRSLTRQVKRLNDREEIAKELRDFQVQAYSAKVATLNKELHAAQKDLQVAEKAQAGALAELQKIQRQVDAEERGSSRHEHFTKLQRQHQELVDQRNRLLTDRAALAGKVAATLSQAGQANVSWLTHRQAEITGRLSAIAEERAASDRKREKLTKQLAEVQEKLSVHAKGIQELEAGLLRAEQALKTRTTLTVPELAKEVAEVLTGHQKFISAVRAADSLEALQALHAEAHRLDTRAAKFLDKLSAQTPTVDPAQLITLQRSLHQHMQEKERVANEEHTLHTEQHALEERGHTFADEVRRLEHEQANVVKELKLAQLKPGSKAEADAAVAQAQAEVDAQLAAVDRELGQARQALDGFNQTEQDKRDTLFALQKAARSAQDEARVAEGKLADARVQLARLETRQEDLLRELRAELPAELAAKAEKATTVPDADVAALEDTIAKAKHNLELIGGIDENAKQEYEQTNERYTFLTTQVDDLTKAGADLEAGIAKLEATIKEKFEKSFDRVSEEFTKYFKMLFNGGNATLQLVKEEVVAPEDMADEDEDDEDEEEEEVLVKPKAKGEKVVTGVEIFATPPGKRLRGIAMLSGGERALTSIALICAILASNPSPFVVLDEVDAALDESNSIRFAQILAKLAHRTQFITITHNRATMAEAALLYGVTMGDDGVSKLLSVKMEDVGKVIAGVKK